MTTTVQVAGRDDTTALAELRHLWTAETWDMTDDVTFGERFSRWVAAPVVIAPSGSPVTAGDPWAW